MSVWSSLKNSMKNGVGSAVNSVFTGSSTGKETGLSGISSVADPAPAPVDVNPGSVTDQVSGGYYYEPVSSSGSGSFLSGLGSVLGGIGSVVGGLLGFNEQKKANKIAQKQFAETLAFQKDQFYNAMQHRVHDALKAGVHPLAALGVQAHGSASPTAHVQAATGLGSAVQGLSAQINSFFENAIKIRQLDMLQSQINANKALAIKYSADAGRQVAETAYTNKELDNYHVYRSINAVTNGIGAVTGGLRAGAAFRAAGRPIQRYYGDIHFSN